MVTHSLTHSLQGHDNNAENGQSCRWIAGSKIIGIAAGAEHSMAVSADGQLFSWGSGSNGRLGHAQRSSRLWYWNRDETTPRLVHTMTEKAVSVSCGHMHSGEQCKPAACMLWGWLNLFEL